MSEQKMRQNKSQYLLPNEIHANTPAEDSIGRKIQTVARDTGQLSQQRSLSRGGQLRGVKTDRRGDYRPDSRTSEGHEEENKHHTSVSSDKFEGTLKFSKQQLSRMGNNTTAGRQ